MGMTTRVGRSLARPAILLIAASAAACSGPAEHPQPRPPSTLRAIAVLTSEHPVNGKEKVLHDPLVGYSVIAVETDGRRFTAAIDRAGTAVLSLPAGRYVVTTTDEDACPPATVTLASAERRRADLRCVAP
jgi:hypothetical protein